MKHFINRTSPKGEEFVGTCALCGISDLKITDAGNDCENVRGITQEDALVEALRNTSPGEGE